MIDLPSHFITKFERDPSMPVDTIIEPSAAKYFRNVDIQNWQYALIHWTYVWMEYSESKLNAIFNYCGYKLKKFNKNFQRLVDAQEEKVFTIVQHCKGIEFHDNIELSDDILVFGSAGVGLVPLPLFFCEPRVKLTRKRNYLASFKGGINKENNLYPFREILSEVFTEDKYCIVDTVQDGHEQYDYDELLCWSDFSFCPRGIGRTSFRLREVMAVGSIPIYFYDDFPWLPYEELIDWNEIAIIVHYKEPSKVNKRIEGMSREKIEAMREKLNPVYEKYFSMDFALDYVKEFMLKNKDYTVAEIKDKYKHISSERDKCNA